MNKLAILALATSLLSPLAFAGATSSGGGVAHFGFSVECTGTQVPLEVTAKGYFEDTASLTFSLATNQEIMSAHVSGDYQNGLLSEMHIASLANDHSSTLDIAIPEALAHGQQKFDTTGTLSTAQGGSPMTFPLTCKFSTQ